MFLHLEAKNFKDKIFNKDYRPIYIGKNQNPKNLGFCCTVYTARKTHSILGFWHEKRMREKNLNLILVFW